jgi:sirohydrochlorin cobaltochelatase
MKQKILVVGILILIFLFGVSSVFARGVHGAKKPVKKAILLVAFGTSVPAAQKAFDRIEEKAKKAFPGVEIRWAFTSKIIRAKLAKQGNRLDSPVVALAKLMEDNYTHVVICSLHSLPGEEFHDLYVDTHAFRGMKDGFQKLLLSRPLLSSREDMERVAAGLLKMIPSSRKPGDAVIFMGHGSEHHPGDAVYAALQYYLTKKDPNAYVGTVEGNPKLDDILPELKKKGVKKAYLAPCMAVAGDHARNDMAGEEPDSWKSVLKKNGIVSEAVLVGAAEVPEIADIWIDHAKKAYAHFK